ncbi:MAG: hypothetical protein JST91_02360 [Actinobacteria bacterium]|nr:hypothetical protein [Actinomycetota bacterium]
MAEQLVALHDGAGITAWIDQNPSKINTSRAVATAVVDAAFGRKFFNDLAAQTGANDPVALADQSIVLHDGAIATAQMNKTSRSAAVTAKNMARPALLAAGVQPSA